MIATKSNNEIYIPDHYRLTIDRYNYITYCKAEGSYTKIYFSDKESVMTARRLKIIQQQLSNNGFIRCHKSYLVNVRFIKEVRIKTPALIVLQSGETIKIACRKLRNIKQYLYRKFLLFE